MDLLLIYSLCLRVNFCIIFLLIFVFIDCSKRRLFAHAVMAGLLSMVLIMLMCVGHRFGVQIYFVCLLML
jgi:hypothetical protein